MAGNRHYGGTTAAVWFVYLPREFDTWSDGSPCARGTQSTRILPHMGQVLHAREIRGFISRKEKKTSTQTFCKRLRLPGTRVWCNCSPVPPRHTQEPRRPRPLPYLVTEGGRPASFDEAGVLFHRRLEVAVGRLGSCAYVEGEQVEQLSSSRCNYLCRAQVLAFPFVGLTPRGFCARAGTYYEGAQ